MLALFLKYGENFFIIKICILEENKTQFLLHFHKVIILLDVSILTHVKCYFLKSTLKDKNYVIISIYAEKVFEKIQHAFIKLKILGIEGIYLNIMKIIHDKLTDIILNSEKLKIFFSKIKNKTIALTLTTSIPHGNGSLSQRNYARKRNKWHLICKERCKIVGLQMT